MPRNRFRILTIIYPLFLISILFLGCNRTHPSNTEIEQEIKQILSLREEAMENKDINRYMQCISRDYRDKNETYARIQEKMEKNFDAFEMIDLSQTNQFFYQERGRVMVVQDYELSFIMAGKRDYVRGKEMIFFEKQKGV